jgi:integrase
VTYAQAMGRFDAEHIDVLRPQTAKRYRVSITALHKGFGTLFLDEIDKAHMSAYVAMRKANGISGAAIRHDLAVLGSMMRSAINWGWLKANIARDFDKRSIPPPNKRERYLTDAELARLYDACQPDLLRIVAFAVETGMRLGEILGLRHQDIDWQRMEARLWDQRTKNKTSRTVPLSDKALLQVGSQAGTGFVFGLSTGGKRREDTIGHRFARLCRRAGVADATFHDLRHTFASRAIQGKFDWQDAPFDLPRLQKWLGHKTIAQTMRYSHLASDDLRALVRRQHTGRDMNKVESGLTS